jgi:hypothetical protein
MLRRFGFNPLAALWLATLSALFGQPPGIVRILNVEFTEEPQR